jgi:hypothetical protein
MPCSDTWWLETKRNHDFAGSFLLHLQNLRYFTITRNPTIVLMDDKHNEIEEQQSCWYLCIKFHGLQLQNYLGDVINGIKTLIFYFSQYIFLREMVRYEMKWIL